MKTLDRPARTRRRTGERPRSPYPTLRKLRAGELRRRRGQIAGIVVTIFLGIVLYGASYDAFLNLQASYDEMYSRLAFADLTVAGGDVDAFAAEAGADPAVAAITVRRVSEVPMEIDGHRLLGRVVGLPADREPAVNRIMVLRGGSDPIPAPGEIFLEQHAADHHGVDTGATIRILGAGGDWREFPVGAVVASPEYIWPARSRQDILTSPEDFAVAFAADPTLDMFSGVPVRQVVLTLARDADREAALARLTKRATALGALDVFDKSEQPSNAGIQEDVQGFGELSYMFPVLFLGAAGLAMYVLLTRLVFSQRPLIGLLRAQGHRRRTINRHYLGYGLLIGLLGAVPGAIAGIGAAALVTRLYTSALSVPVVVNQVRPSTVAGGIAFGLVGGALSALAPSRTAARIEPAAAMRGLDGDRAVARPSILERVVRPLRRAPIIWRMVLRGPARNPRRTVSTMIGIVLAGVLVLTSWGMIDTTQILLDQQFNRIQRQDAVAVFPAAAPPGADRTAAAVAGVQRVETVVSLPVSIRVGEEVYATVLNAFDSDTQMHDFVVDGSSVAPPDDGILAGRPLRDLLGVGPGSSVVLEIPGLNLQATTSIREFVDEPLGTLAYTTKDHLAQLAGGADPDALVNALYITYEDGVDRAEMRRALAQALPEAAIQDARTLYETAQSFMGLFYAFVGVMLVFGGIMAFALIFAAMSANVAERAGEIAVLRASGASTRTIASTISAENLLVTVVALPIGIAAGWALAAVFMGSFSSDLFQFDLHMRPTTPLFTAVGILLAALIAQTPVLKTVRGIDIARVVRDRSL